MMKTNYLAYRKKFLITALILIFLSCLIFFIGLIAGSLPLDLKQLFFRSTAMDEFVIGLRFHREVLAVCCGGMLATGSAMLQGLTRNSMVAPDLIGMTSTGCLLIIACDIFFMKSPLTNEILGIVGAILGFVLCFALTKNNNTNRLMTVLTGISISFATSAFIQLLVLKAPENMDAYLHFLTGSLYATTGETACIVSVVALMILPIAFALSLRFSVFSLDDQTCRSLGVPLKQYRFICFLVAAVLVGSSIVGIGHLGFLGIVAPNIARLIMGNRPQYVLPLSFLTGSLMYSIADILGRCLISPAEIPAGIMANLIAAPLFLYILFQYYRDPHERN